LEQLLRHLFACGCACTCVDLGGGLSYGWGIGVKAQFLGPSCRRCAINAVSTMNSYTECSENLRR
jgi:hypothetical protein